MTVHGNTMKAGDDTTIYGTMWINGNV